MNGFEQHGIEHLSASSINLWTNAPDVWVAKYILNRPTPFGPAPKRGQAVEHAVADVLAGESIENAVASAEEWFDLELFADPEATARERAHIAPMTEIAVDELKQYGKPEFTEDGQEKINITANCGDFKMPVIGFLDFVFPDHGLVVDLKTTLRIPSEMSPEHKLQRVIYARAKGNMAVKFLYVSPKKASWLEDGDELEILPKLKTHIARLERFLRDRSADELAATVPVNPTSFYWRGAEAMRSEIYGL